MKADVLGQVCFTCWNGSYLRKLTPQVNLMGSGVWFLVMFYLWCLAKTPNTKGPHSHGMGNSVSIRLEKKNCTTWDAPNDFDRNAKPTFRLSYVVQEFFPSTIDIKNKYIYYIYI